MDNVEITTMTIEDFEAISPILVSEFDDFWTPNTLKKELENGDSEYIVIKLNHEIVGFAGIWKSVDDVHITDIVVKKSHRQKNFGSLLLQELIYMTQELNYKELTLEVNSKNEIAKKLYLKYGFKELGIRKKYYNNTDDAIIMTLYID